EGPDTEDRAELGEAGHADLRRVRHAPRRAPAVVLPTNGYLPPTGRRPYTSTTPGARRPPGPRAAGRVMPLVSAGHVHSIGDRCGQPERAGADHPRLGFRRRRGAR